MNKAKYQILNTLWLKVIVIITMTLDHIGAFLEKYFLNINEALVTTGDAFRIVGRIAFPLVALLFAEAMKHTHDQEHYLSRLGLFTVIILAVEIGVYYGTNFELIDGNIFLTLLCSGLFIYFYEKKDYRRLLMIIPLAIIILSFTTDILKYNAFYPSYLKAQFSLYGFILCVGFYFIYSLVDKRVLALTHQQKDLQELRQYGYYRSLTNLLWGALLFLTTVFFWLISFINDTANMYNISLQSYAMLAVIPILLYSGEKGYNNKIVQYSFYVYYPIHILIIFLSFYLILGVPLP
ncbi:MAG: conjugal transfer protein TraX [Bacilli bacterium]|nr:conjugal transfer protein TraX [Bacilli bacterium]